MKIFKKLIAAIAIFNLLFTNVGVVLAQEMPEAPIAPTAPAAPIAPTAPTAPVTPNLFVTPTPVEPTPTPTPRPTHTPRPTSTPTPEVVEAVTAVVPANVDNNSTGGTNSNGQSGGSAVVTGNANNFGLLSTDANTNLAGLASGVGAGATVVNDGNGSDSTNNANAQSVSASTLIQDNQATILNSMGLGATSGHNTASDNTGGDSAITTGDANVSGTVITTANTNAAGVSMSEFNIPNNQVGDYILDFSANCIYNCTSENSVSNTGNGAGSNNNASNVNVVDTGTFQTNNANIDNSLVLKANSGDNRADRNTGGDSAITTGDANVSANALTLANNNIQGQILYGVVNIYGDLHGDIIFPEDQFTNCCGTSTGSVSNIGNGTDSTNTATGSVSTTDTTVQTNVASINNNLDLNAQTGDNTTSRNTDGSSGITTGDSNVTASVVNVANSNISGDTWLVLVNNAGTWTGQIMGANGNIAASTGMQFNVGKDGTINVTNAGNGADSTNTAAGSVSTTNTTVQTNNLNLNNNLDLSANTGNNSASRNTGGTSSVTTGDANIVANLVNFVNNNISHNGRLIVTVVNVFGTWVGNFVGPGQQPLAKTEQISSDAIATTSLVSSTPTPTVTPVNSNNSNAPTPTPTKASTQVLAIVGGSGGSIVKVAGYSTENTGNIADVLTGKSVNGKKVVHVNLAWALLLLPLGGIFLITKKKLLS